MDKCIVCGNEIIQTTKYRVSAKRKRVTCSTTCHHKLVGIRQRGKPSPRKKLILPQSCERCGKEFIPKGHYKVHYCSWHCAHLIPKGKDNWSWKGGRILTSGYVRVYMPNHPFADSRGYILEHRLVMEQYLGRVLGRGEVVHHLNGIKDDNRIENLSLYRSQKSHKSHHPNIVCPHCGKPFILVNSTPISGFS